MKESEDRHNKGTKRELSRIEDSEAFPATVQGVARLAAKSAMAEAKVLKIPVTYLKGTDIIKKFPDGTMEVLGRITSKKHPKTLKKGAVLHARKK